MDKIEERMFAREAKARANTFLSFDKLRDDVGIFLLTSEKREDPQVPGLFLEKGFYTVNSPSGVNIFLRDLSNEFDRAFPKGEGVTPLRHILFNTKGKPQYHVEEILTKSDQSGLLEITLFPREKENGVTQWIHINLVNGDVSIEEYSEQNDEGYAEEMRQEIFAQFHNLFERRSIELVVGEETEKTSQYYVRFNNKTYFSRLLIRNLWSYFYLLFGKKNPNAKELKKLLLRDGDFSIDRIDSMLLEVDDNIVGVNNLTIFTKTSEDPNKMKTLRIDYLNGEFTIGEKDVNTERQ